MIAIVAPGQGAQTPGFLAPWLELDSFRDLLATLSEAAELDLAQLATEADADTIRDTAIAQPLLVAAGIATAAELVPDLPADSVTAGHSVGEITAAALAGVLSPTDAMTFVATRGRGMAEASALRPTSMTAVVGGNADEVLAAIEKHGLTPANNNGSGQVVAAGTVEQLAALAEEPPARARLFPLSVAGAFHTEHMAPAQDRLRDLAAGLTTSDPGVTLLSNRDGLPVASGAEFLDRLVSQVTSPVRWDLCLEQLRTLGGAGGITGLLELAPAGTLTGIAKRNLKGVDLFNLNTPDQLDEARAFVRTHTRESENA
ncbi:ACP S-malonyltransferase [Aestuariimicrobium soli]|uniref:ACP S-malonyltransferase n=1 Tax=Aestuariimicrobium soli TaxID=2035834 RepID=UPI003EBF8514